MSLTFSRKIGIAGANRAFWGIVNDTLGQTGIQPVGIIDDASKFNDAVGQSVVSAVNADSTRFDALVQGFNGQVVGERLASDIFKAVIVSHEIETKTVASESFKVRAQEMARIKVRQDVAGLLDYTHDALIYYDEFFKDGRGPDKKSNMVSRQATADCLGVMFKISVDVSDAEEETSLILSKSDEPIKAYTKVLYSVFRLAQILSVQWNRDVLERKVRNVLVKCGASLAKLNRYTSALTSDKTAFFASTPNQRVNKLAEIMGDLQNVEIDVKSFNAKHVKDAPTPKAKPTATQQNGIIVHNTIELMQQVKAECQTEASQSAFNHLIETFSGKLKSEDKASLRFDLIDEIEILAVEDIESALKAFADADRVRTEETE